MLAPNHNTCNLRIAISSREISWKFDQKVDWRSFKKRSILTDSHGAGQNKTPGGRRRRQCRTKCLPLLTLELALSSIKARGPVYAVKTTNHAHLRQRPQPLFNAHSRLPLAHLGLRSFDLQLKPSSLVHSYSLLFLFGADRHEQPAASTVSERAGGNAVLFGGRHFVQQQLARAREGEGVRHGGPHALADGHQGLCAVRDRRHFATSGTFPFTP